MARVTEDEVNKLTERYYKEVERCLIASNIYDKVIRKFPPMALRSAVKHVVERFLKTENDPETFDWCTFFSEITDFETVEDFLRYLDSNRYIPPDPEQAIAEELSFIERRLAELGYRIVKEEEWARVTGRYERLEREVRKLREERRKLEARVKELEAKLQELAEKGSTRMPPPRLPVVEVPKPKTVVYLRDRMTFDAFLAALAREASFRTNLNQTFVRSVAMEVAEELKSEYDRATHEEFKEIVSRFTTYIASEHIPRKCSVMDFVALRGIGVNVRHPNPVIMTRYVDGVWTKIVEPPPISYIEPRFDSWLANLRAIGFSITICEPVPVEPGKTHVVVDPRHELEKVRAILCGDAVVGVSADSIVYTINEEKKYIFYCRYRPYRVPG